MSQDVPIVPSRLSHAVRSRLAEADAVPGAVAVKQEEIALPSHLVQIALDPIPADRPADLEAELRRRDDDLLRSAQTEGAGASRRRALPHLDGVQPTRDAQTGGIQRPPHLLFRDLGAPLAPALVRAVRILDAPQIGQPRPAPDVAGFLGLAAAVGVVVGRGRLPLPPQQLPLRRLRGAAHPVRHGRQPQVLAVRGIAEIETLRCVTSTELRRERSRRHRHRLEPLVRDEAAAFSSQHGSDVLFQGDARRQEKTSPLGPHAERRRHPQAQRIVRRPLQRELAADLNARRGFRPRPAPPAAPAQHQPASVRAQPGGPRERLRKARGADTQARPGPQRLDLDPRRRSQPVEPHVDLLWIGPTRRGGPAGDQHERGPGHDPRGATPPAPGRSHDLSRHAAQAAKI